jgi:phytoene dehydrogenase-like protein
MPIRLGGPFSFDQTLPLKSPEGDIEAVADTRVAIVGAGLAGLTCAYRLAQMAGRKLTRDDVLVLEREPHSGGRVRSLQIGATVLNLGALTFQPAHYPRFSALLADLGLAEKVRPIPRRRMIFGVDGRAVRADNLSLAGEGARGLFGRGVFTPAEAAQLLRFVWLLRRLSSPEGGAELKALHELSVAEWARRFGFGESLRRKFVEPFTHFCFRAPQEVSAAFGIFLLGFNLSHPATLNGGFGQVPDRIAERLNGLIETEAIALEVRRKPGGFETVYSRSGQLRRLQSRFLVVALPANIAAKLVPEMRQRAGEVEYGAGRGAILSGRLKVDADLHLRSASGEGGTTIYGGEIRPNGDGGHYLNLLTYRGEGAVKEVAQLFVDGRIEQLADYAIDPASPAPKPGQIPLPIDWGDGLYLAGDCAGLFPSQETAVSSGEEVARLLQNA